MFYSGSLDTYHAGKIVKSKVKKKYSLAPPRETTGRLTGDSHLLPVTPFPIPPVLSPAMQQNIWGSLSPAPSLQNPTDLAFPVTLPLLVPGLSSNSLSFLMHRSLLPGEVNLHPSHDSSRSNPPNLPIALKQNTGCSLPYPPIPHLLWIPWIFS